MKTKLTAACLAVALIAALYVTARPASHPLETAAPAMERERAARREMAAAGARKGEAQARAETARRRTADSVSAVERLREAADKAKRKRRAAEALEQPPLYSLIEKEGKEFGTPAVAPEPPPGEAIVIAGEPSPQGAGPLIEALTEENAAQAELVGGLDSALNASREEALREREAEGAAIEETSACMEALGASTRALRMTEEENGELRRQLTGNKTIIWAVSSGAGALLLYLLF